MSVRLRGLHVHVHPSILELTARYKYHVVLLPSAMMAWFAMGKKGASTVSVHCLGPVPECFSSGECPLPYGCEEPGTCAVLDSPAPTDWSVLDGSKGFIIFNANSHFMLSIEPVKTVQIVGFKIGLYNPPLATTTTGGKLYYRQGLHANISFDASDWELLSTYSFDNAIGTKDVDFGASGRLERMQCIFPENFSGVTLIAGLTYSFYFEVPLAFISTNSAVSYH